MELRGGALDRHGLRAARLPVDLDPAEARQDVGDGAVHEVGAVELGRDLHREPLPAPGRLHPAGIGDRPQEVAAEPDERLHASIEEPLAGLHRVEPLLPRWLEVVEFLQPVERCQFGLLGDADGTLTLHVRVAPHRADPGAGLSDIAAQKQQVDEHPDGLGALAVLGQAHPVDADHRLRAGVDAGGRLQRRPGQSGAPLQGGPILPVAEADEGLEAVGVLGDEGAIEDPRPAGGVRRPVEGEQRLAQAGERREIPAGFHLVILRRNLGGGARQHLYRRLRVGEALQPAFPEGVEGDDLGPRRRASWSGCSIRGEFDPTFWPKKKIRSVVSKSSSSTVPTGAPIDCGRATEVGSWHMLEESGRLLLP